MISFSVPATSANLGSGFDSVAIALDLRMHARAHRSLDQLHIQFSGAELPTHDGLAACIRSGMALVCTEPSELKLSIEIENAIPLGVGLGSSAAARLCGLLIAAESLELALSKADVLELVARVEGHADNAAAALHGQLCFVLHQQTNIAVLKLPFPAALRCAIVLPAQSLDTQAARNALPELYTRRAVSSSLQAACMLAAGLASGSLEHLAATTRDIIHQPYRAAMIPGLRDALAHSDADACAVISGAGPSVLVISKGDPMPSASRAAQYFERAGVSTRVQPVAIDQCGVRAISPRRQASSSDIPRLAGARQ
ncbi:MAG: homoserine kinase [Candidatus Eremiobacteraeota bacterium]|nr:homoserine kinase [Candidatus Eremiobacteraeota bacterium]